MLNSTLGVLLVGDQPQCLRLLREQSFEVSCTDRLAGGLEQLKAGHANVALMCLSLPDGKGAEAFTKLHEAALHVPIVVLAKAGEEKQAASTMALGAQDYLLETEWTGPALAKAIRNAFERQSIRDEHSRAGYLLDALMNTIPDSIYFKDKMSRFIMVNRAQAKKLQLPDPHLAVGKSDADFFQSSHAQQALADEQRIMQTDQPLVGVEEKETWQDGRETWVSTTKMALRSRGGKVIGTFGISRDITEHRRIEQALARANEEQGKAQRLLQAILDNVPDLIYCKDTQSRFLKGNRVLAELLGLKSPDQMIGKTDFDFNIRERAQEFFDDEQRIMKTGVPLLDKTEKQVLASGEIRWTSTTKIPLRDEDGKVVGLVGISRDITEHKLAEDSLARERLLLRTLIDNLPDCIYAKDTAGRKVMANPADLKNLNCKTEAEAVGKTDFDLFPRELAQKFFDDDQKVIHGEPVLNREEYVLDGEGNKSWLLTSKLPMRDRDGKVIGLVGIGRDITKRKIAEEALDQERRLLRTLIDNLPDAIYAKDTAGRKTLANLADLRNLGCKTEAETLGKTDFDLFPREHAERLHADDQQVIKGHSIINREEHFQDREGRDRWLLTSKLPLHDQDGKVIGLVGINREITGRKQAEIKLAFERDLFQTLLDNLPDAIYFKDRESRFVRVSRWKVERTLAVVQKHYLATLPANAPKELPPHLTTPEKFGEYLPGKSDFDFYPDERARSAFEDEQQIIRSGQPRIGKLERTPQLDGGVSWVITTKMPWRDKSGNIIGTFGVSRDVTELKETEEKLAEHTRQLERKNRQTAEELKMARELQLAMLPHEFPCVPPHKPRSESHLDFFSFFFPSGAVSGDFFDVIPLSDTSVGLFICDVMGHDVRAALVTAMMRSLVVDSNVKTDPGELLAQINREVAGIFRQTATTMYATAFYLIADVARAELRYASAAHPEPMLLHRHRGTAEWLGNGAGKKKGPALGLFAEGQFPTHRCPMEVGDLIALFTDGLIETEGAGNESFSPERLLASVSQRAAQPTNELFSGLFDEIKRFSASSDFDDDVCIVGMEIKGLEAKQGNGKV